MRRVVSALAIVAAFPSAASAAVVTAVPPNETDPAPGGSLSITAAPGQRNSLTLIVRGKHVTVTEGGRTRLKAGYGCVQQSVRRVTCRLFGIETYDLSTDLGDGDDRLSVSDPEGELLDIQLAAGSGNDVITLGTQSGASVYGGPGRDVLRGSRARDFLQGGSGSDRLFGRGGADVLTGDTGRPRSHGSDLLDGGPGRDTASWEGRTKGVRVDLAAGIVGQRGERDIVRDIEDLSGGSGPDVLRGNGGPNILEGGPGKDWLVGRGGPDTLDGSANLIQTEFGEADGARDRFVCGRGLDAVNNPDKDVLPHDCELLAATPDYNPPRPDDLTHAQPRPTGRGVEVETVCGNGPCTRRVTLRAHGRVLGRSATRAGHQFERLWIDVPLKRPLPRGTPIKIEVAGTDSDTDDTYGYRFAWRVRR